MLQHSQNTVKNERYTCCTLSNQTSSLVMRCRSVRSISFILTNTLDHAGTNQVLHRQQKQSYISLSIYGPTSCDSQCNAAAVHILITNTKYLQTRIWVTTSLVYSIIKLIPNINHT